MMLYRFILREIVPSFSVLFVEQGREFSLYDYIMPGSIRELKRQFPRLLAIAPPYRKPSTLGRYQRVGRHCVATQLKHISLSECRYFSTQLREHFVFEPQILLEPAIVSRTWMRHWQYFRPVAFPISDRFGERFRLLFF